MTKEKKKTGVLGIGNLLLSDESFGIHVVNHLMEHHDIPDSVTIVDGGTAGIYMAPFLEEHDPVLVIDVVDVHDAQPGSLYTFTAHDVRKGLMQTRMSPHQLGILEILEICRLRGDGPETVEFLCVVPESLATSLEMSDAVASQVSVIADKVVSRLRDLGHAVGGIAEKDA